MSTTTLNTAIQIAANAHMGQTDLAGQPYILHPLRVMMTLSDHDNMTAAILHDVVEDSHVTLDDLRQAGIPESVVVAVNCLTKREGEVYDIYLNRVAGNAIALRVKLADLEDNMHVERLLKVTDRDRKRLEKYRFAKEFLISF